VLHRFSNLDKLRQLRHKTPISLNTAWTEALFATIIQPTKLSFNHNSYIITYTHNLTRWGYIFRL